MRSSAEIRQSLIETLELDLVGPGPGHPLENELLWNSEPPSRFYLTGFLVPSQAPEEQRFDPESNDDFSNAPGASGDESPDPEEATAQPSAKKAFLPSSIGLSVLVSGRVQSLQATVLWGEYQQTDVPKSQKPNAPPEEAERKEIKAWKRTQRSSSLAVPLPEGKNALGPALEVPESGGVKLYVSARDAGRLGPEGLALPEGIRAVSVFVVNERTPELADRAEERKIFQVKLSLSVAPDGDGFVGRPDMRGLNQDDKDERVADLQYRDVVEYAVGHGVSAHAVVENGRCGLVHTTWVPVAAVERVESDVTVPGVELSMEKLGDMPDAASFGQALMGLGTAYGAWIEAQRALVPADSSQRAEVAGELIGDCERARARMLRGIQELSDPVVLEAFRLANQAMARAGRQRTAQIRGCDPKDVPEPRWRLFQLAFVLINLVGINRPLDADRETLDLLFFPTGGGKTEAYLGLSAFTLLLRRLRDPGVGSSGVSVLMRYTLRLLTLDQLGRAAALICALELLRREEPRKLGAWPFEIGLWVGRTATPNRMGSKADGAKTSARARTLAFRRDSKGNPSPIPLEVCPFCGEKFKEESFVLVPSADKPSDLRIVCMNDACAFTQDNPLPIVAVDEPLYRRLPCMVIATVDKLASLPWFAAPGKLFGKVERFDRDGFYGPGEDARGASKLKKPLLPPDLIIQDELHLISGPLGTMVGLYETAVEALCTREVDGKKVRPKIVASTATVRRAEAQVRALFNREYVDVFPPPGLDLRDSFFARTASVSEKNARLYVGVSAQGRSLKVVLLRAYLAMLSAAKKLYDEAGGDANANNPADPYMTLLGYFNALKELGGSRRIVEDEVRSRLQHYARHQRMNEVGGPFVNRIIQYEAVELTSRVPTGRVAEAKQRLERRFREGGRVDVALATNMIAVGLDILRLGLMVVLGQPKTSAEYIQATSRVGREEKWPGLVVTLLNVHKPRDRSHYERFEAYHQSFYRAVEAVSVTPFAPRAVDRGLAAVVVALARHGEAALTAGVSAASIAAYRGRLSWLKEAVRERAESHRKDWGPGEREELGGKMLSRVEDLLDAWEQIAEEKNAVQAGLQYGPYEPSSKPPLLHDPLDADLKREAPGSKLRKFRAQWSLRDVEPEVSLIVKPLDAGLLKGEGEKR